MDDDICTYTVTGAQPLSLHNDRPLTTSTNGLSGLRGSAICDVTHASPSQGVGACQPLLVTGEGAVTLCARLSKAGDTTTEGLRARLIKAGGTTIEGQADQGRRHHH